MTLLLEFKEKLKQIYANYGYAVIPVGKFLLAFIIFKSISGTLNFVESLNSIFILLILALICCIMPLNVTVFFGLALIVLQCYGVGVEVAAFALAVILIIAILFIRFASQDAIILLVTPMAFALKIPCVIPIGFGLTKKPSSAISAGCGVILYYLIDLVQQKSSVLQGAESTVLMQNLKLLLDGLVKNQSLMMNVIAFAAVLLIVYVIRSLHVDYAWHMAIVIGGVSYVIIMAAGGLVLDVSNPVIPLLVGTIGSVIVAEMLHFLLFNVDYSRTEMLQFEDDEYVYFVKAVPKMSIAEKDVTVKTIEEDQETDMAPPSDVDGQEYPHGPVSQETIVFAGFDRKMEDVPADTGAPIQKLDDDQMEEVDFESKLEQSLNDL